MPTFEVTAPDGRTFAVTAPAGASQGDVLAYAQSHFGGGADSGGAPGGGSPFDAALAAAKGVMAAASAKPSPASVKDRIDNDAISTGAREFPGQGSDALGGLSQFALNAVAGAVRGAGSIGATLARPFESAQDNAERRQTLDANLQAVGAQPDSLTYKGGKLVTEVAGTLGVGGVLAKPVMALAPLAGAAGPAVEALGSSIASGGFQTGANLGRAADIATRVAGGAITGGAGAGMVSPDQAGAGAVIGGVLPPAFRGGGAAFDALGKMVRNARTPQEVRLAQQMAQRLGVSADDLAALNTGPQVIPGFQPTVPQLLQTPEASQLQRSLKAAGGNAIGDAEHLQQQQLRETLEGIAPIADTTNEAAARAGNAIEDFAIPAQRSASAHVSQLFDAVPADEAKIYLPLQEMHDAQQKFLGPGTFGKGGSAVEQAMETASHIGMDARTLQPIAVPFDQLQALRSSIGEALTQARQYGQNRAVAALTVMKNAIDNKVADVAAGNAQPGEIFTPRAIDSWGQALAAHAQKQAQFGTGPQVGMFRMGADGQPAIQGAEVPGKFFNANASQIEDAQAFKRLVGDRQDLMQVMKGYALTQAHATANQGGDLTQKFLNWVAARSGATEQLFTPQELLKIKSVANAVQRSLTAENLGRATGSDTAQKISSLQSNGLIGGKAADFLLRHIPVVGRYAGPVLDTLRAKSAAARTETMAALLASPQRMEEALRAGAAPAAAPATPSALRMAARAALPVAGAMMMSPSSAAPAPHAPTLGTIMAAPSVDEAVRLAKEYAVSHSAHPGIINGARGY